MQTWNRTARLAAVAQAMFGFGASLSALAGAESPNQGATRAPRYAACVRRLACPLLED